MKTRHEVSWFWFDVMMAVTRPEWPRRWKVYNRYYWSAFLHGRGHWGGLVWMARNWRKAMSDLTVSPPTTTQKD